jgi:hypothetical protein
MSGVLVHWGLADPDLVEPWPLLIRQVAAWPIPPKKLVGSGSGLAGMLSKVPTRRLVVLGEPGTGKTMLLVQLVLDLIAHRSAGDPVPVLVPLASWDPQAEELSAWLQRRLAVDYPGLGEPGPSETAKSRWEELLDDGLILLLLDGLDEIAEKVRGHAIARINKALQPGQVLVLASRSAPFRAAVRPEGGTEILVRGAAGITLRPLDTGDVVSYLRDSADGPTTAARWKPVLSTMLGSTSSPVAQALGTPLMASLARSIYIPRPGELSAGSARNPGDLLHYTDPARIKEHLFDIFIPSAYPASGKRFCWTAKRAERWLVFLARDLHHRDGTTDLNWWDLRAAAPRSLAGICVGLVAGIAGAAGLRIGAGVGLSLITADAVSLVVRRWNPRAAGLARGLTGGIIGGLAGALLAQAVTRAPSQTGSSLAGGLASGLASGSLGGFRAGLTGGFAGGLVGGLVPHPDIGSARELINGLGLGLAAACTTSLALPHDPARQLRWSLRGSVPGLGAGLVLGFALWLQVGLAGGVLAGLVAFAGGGFAAGLEAAPADLTAEASPAKVLARDRATFWITGLAGAAAIGLSSGFAVGLPSGSRLGIEVGLANAIALGLSVGFLQAEYGQYTLARYLLAIQGRLPWRPMSFLSDAHEKRGVLRQIGATYQFRHEELQRGLASRP